MDKNTFWSQTAPSYDLLDYDDESQEHEIAHHRVRIQEDNFTTSYTVVSFEDEEDEPVIEVRFFRTANVEQKDLREKKFHWFSRKK
ncbi:hypothetical protein A9264_05305 [Vibrio sp. UCD-FRSSP16_10]|uniref:hypothetical protein n=1 Tax=unclassified Vibrio TaxID=2614977 RepID=UPI0007FFA315|nr:MULTISPECIES: hypothetical protein [unclassified Vibrio]OBT07888.1 hypothetical protein A9260_07545 [Vibrio sp. UCD-FRSSP16_30]OBT17064.1 hypothetical protein A9264_05305 [Vibrio sp. UCD-FRSSP16_10]